MTRTAVLQPHPGIGDTMWHLPFIRTIAASTQEGRVTFFTRPRTCARELLGAESAIDDVVYVDFPKGLWARWRQKLAFAATLRQGGFDSLWILDKVSRPAISAVLAGVPRRYGFGLGNQSWWISNRPGLDRGLKNAHQIDKLKAFVTQMGLPVPPTEPNLTLPRPLVDAARQRYAHCPHPWIVVGLSASTPWRAWPAAYTAELLDRMAAVTGGTFFLLGVPHDHGFAEALVAGGGGHPMVKATDQSMAEAAGLMANARLFVGPDSGPMNVAAALGIPAFGLFGATPVLTHSRHVHALTPDDGRICREHGMERIAPERVFDALRSRLAHELVEHPCNHR